MNVPCSAAPAPCPPAIALARFAALAALCFALASSSVAQIRPTPLPGDGGVVITPPIVNPPGGGGGGNAGGGNAGGGAIGITPPIVVPPIGGGGGGGGNITQPTIIAPAGALAGATVSATAVLSAGVVIPATPVGTTGATYQWSISGGRLTADARGATISFVADSPGTVNLAVTISAAGTTYMPTASVAIVSAETAGTITTPATVAASATAVTATVPAAQSGDRSFRWNVSGGAVGSSRVDLQACKLEYSIVSPK